MRPGRKKRKTGIYLLILVVLGLCLHLRNGKEKSLTQERELMAQKKNFQTQILEEEERRDSLNEEKAYRQTKQYVEEVAREKLGLVKPDDILLRDEEN